MQTLVLLAGLLHTAPVPAPPAPRAFIVIAGISAYADKEVPPRPQAEDDARALHALLADRRYLGAGKDHMRLLLGKAATRRNLLASMQWLRDRAGPDDLALFAFFGHGASLGERGDRVCYLASDSTLAGRADDAVTAGDVADIFDQLRTRRVLVLLDVPFTGFRTKRTVAQPNSEAKAFREFTGDDATSEHRPHPHRLVVAREGRFAPDLLRALPGGADAGEGVVTSTGLASSLSKRLAGEQPALRVVQGDGPSFPLVLDFAGWRKQVAHAPLARDRAEEFAKRILDLCEAIREDHILSPETPRLLRLGILGLYERIREPVPAEVARQLDKMKILTVIEQKGLLADIRQQVGCRDELDNGKDLVWTGQEMLARLDRGSSYDHRDIFCIRRPQSYGIGLVLRKSAATGLLEVVTPLLDSPAHKAGVLAGDVIASITRHTDIEGQDLDIAETTWTNELPLEACARLLLGKEGATVGLTLQRRGQDGPRTIEVPHGHVELQTVHGRRRNRDGSWVYYLDAKQQIGYLRISSFSRSAQHEVQAVVRQLRAKGLKGLVLDLRFNPGGLLATSTGVAALLLEKSEIREPTIVTFKGPEGKAEVLRHKPGGAAPGVPVVVLVNQETASGSEILAACLQDTKRALIVGERSQGKGGVQNFLHVDLMLTTAVFVRPSGKCLNRFTDADNDWGVRPDVEVRLSRREREELYERLRNSETLPRPDRPLIDPYAGFKDVQLEKALDHLRRKMAGR